MYMRAMMVLSFLLAVPAVSFAEDPKPASGAAPAAKETKPAAAPVAAAKDTKLAAAAAGAGPAMPTPAKELDEFMKPFVGAWTCDTRFPAGSMGPGSPEVKTKSTVKMKKDLNGFFYRGEYNVPKSKDVPAAFGGVFYIGYDQASKVSTNVSVDTYGSAILGSGPITGNTVTWNGTGYAMGAKVKTKETMSKKGDKEATHTYEMDMGKGFQLMGEDTCKKK